MLLSNESQLIEQAKLAYSPLGKPLKNKQTKKTKQMKIKEKSKER